MKSKNQVKDILAEAGRFAVFTNRSFSCKATNAALSTGLVRIQVAPNGKIWDKPKKHNLKVFAANFTRIAYITGEITTKDILNHIGALLLDPRVKEKIMSDVHLRSESCHKCNGDGIIPHFHYYCSGICFDCGGTGRNFSNEKTTVSILSNP